MKRTPIRPVSKKRTKLNVMRRKFAAEFLEDYPVCQSGICESHASTEVHEALRRSQGGEIIPGPKAEAQGQVFWALCRTCHDRITFATGEFRQWCLAEGLIQLKFRAAQEL